MNVIIQARFTQKAFLGHKGVESSAVESRFCFFFLFRVKRKVAVKNEVIIRINMDVYCRKTIWDNFSAVESCAGLSAGE